MKWSFKLGRFAGIDVYLHATFLLFLAVVGGLEVFARGSVTAALQSVLFFCAVFGCVLLHEYGHALTARRYGIRTRDITLLPIGGVARLERMPDRPIQELWVALAGPAVNVVIAAILGLWLMFVGTVDVFGSMEIGRGPYAERLLLINVLLVVFNMIPAFPMDGGRVLRAMLALHMDYARATRIAASLGQAIALVFAFLGLRALFGGGGNPMLLFIALFVWIGAGQEAGAAQFRSELAGARVRDAMLTSFSTLAPEDPLARAVDLVMAGSQQDFPVLQRGRVVGVLTRQRLLGALAQSGRWVPVGTSMDREFALADADESLELTLQGRAGPNLGPVPVLERGLLVGVLTWDNITDFLLIQSALRRAPADVGMPPVLRV